MNIPPMYFAWDGNVMVPFERFANLAERSFTSGHAYRLIVDEERSSSSHRQYFAAVREAFMNLPEQWADRFATPEHLRKWCLIRSGFRNEIIHPCDSVAEAVRTVKLARKMDDYALVVRQGAVVHVYTAKSQAYSAMSRGEFQRSKTAVLDELARMLDVAPDELASNRAA